MVTHALASPTDGFRAFLPQLQREAVLTATHRHDPLRTGTHHRTPPRATTLHHTRPRTTTHHLAAPHTTEHHLAPLHLQPYRSLLERPKLLGVAKELIERLDAHLEAGKYYSVQANMRGESAQEVAKRMLETEDLGGLQVRMPSSALCVADV